MTRGNSSRLLNNPLRQYYLVSVVTCGQSDDIKCTTQLGKYFQSLNVPLIVYNVLKLFSNIILRD